MPTISVFYRGVADTAIGFPYPCFWCRRPGSAFRLGRPMWLSTSIGRIGSRCISRSVCRHVEINKDFSLCFHLVALVHIAKVERWVIFDVGRLFRLVRFSFSTLGFLVVESCFVCNIERELGSCCTNSGWWLGLWVLTVRAVPWRNTYG